MKNNNENGLKLFWKKPILFDFKNDEDLRKKIVHKRLKGWRNLKRNMTTCKTFLMNEICSVQMYFPSVQVQKKCKRAEQIVFVKKVLKVLL